jgi:hypothetical protein
MPQRDTSGIGERIPRELIDAEFTIAFSMVEMAEGEGRPGHSGPTSPLLEKAGQMLANIRERLSRMTHTHKEVFEPRCAELSEAIERAKALHSGIEPESEA